jgi:hypothetical protein
VTSGDAKPPSHSSDTVAPLASAVGRTPRRMSSASALASTVSLATSMRPVDSPAVTEHHSQLTVGRKT